MADIAFVDLSFFIAINDISQKFYNSNGLTQKKQSLESLRA